MGRGWREDGGRMEGGWRADGGRMATGSNILAPAVNVLNENPSLVVLGNNTMGNL